MSIFGKFKTLSFGYKVDDIVTSNGKPVYNKVLLNWSYPKDWKKGASPPKGPKGPCIYIIMRDHGNSYLKKQICYIGLTANPANRFGNHPKAKELVKKNGQASISFAAIKLNGKNKINRTKTTMEQIEHILIWTLEAWLENDKKMQTLPGTGLNNCIPWHITNEGFRFHGKMPLEIIYPTASVIPGRNRSTK